MAVGVEANGVGAVAAAPEGLARVLVRVLASAREGEMEGKRERRMEKQIAAEVLARVSWMEGFLATRGNGGFSRT